MTALKKHILVVDDETEICELVKGQLTSAFPGVQVLSVSNGQEAFQKMSRQKFDILITDLQMPRMDGNNLIKAVQNDLNSMYRPRQIVVLSAHIAEELKKKIEGALSYLPKPFTPEALVTRVQEVLNSTSAQPEGASAPGPAAAKPAAPAAAKVDVNFIVPFIDSTLQVLATMANIRPTREALFLRTDDGASGDISTVIPMDCSKFTGSMAVCFEESCFLHIVGALLGEKYTEITDEIADAASEIGNQVFGTTKTVLNSHGLDLKPAIPKLFRGKGHRVQHLVEGPCLAVKFKTEAGCFLVETVIKPRT
jgi:chemotaxis protein CheX